VIAIVGGGIVGLATAYALRDRRPVVFEKEREVARHQTGHNSGVIHSGIYYKPGSYKARLCVEGARLLQDFCREHGIAHRICGKVIVATDPSELPRLDELERRGRANGVELTRIGPERLREIEPHAAGIAALHVPGTGIVDYVAVARKLASFVEVRTGVRVGSARQIGADLVINCAGLHSDRLTRLSGQAPSVRIVPFRGEYYELKPSAHELCRGLIYPVPDPNFPFLGVHFTRMIHGGVECGPNAVLAFAREGYYKTSINVFDCLESLTYSGFLRLVAKHWRAGMKELWRSLSKPAFVAALQRLVPEIRSEDLVSAPAGVRAQALTPQGDLVDDFLIQETDLVVNVCNAPSPAATASLNVGNLVVDRLAPRLGGSAVEPRPGVRGGERFAST